MSKNKFSTQFLVQAGIMIAIATVLSYIKIFQMPQGGSVTAGSMIPIMLIGLIYGPKKGIITGIVHGLLQALLEGYVVHPLQFLLDYPIAFGCLGLSGIFSNKLKSLKINNLKKYLYIIIGVLISILGRFVSHVISGSIFFKEYAGADNPWIYSIIYNSTYLLVEFAISSVVLILLWKSIEKFIFKPSF